MPLGDAQLDTLARIAAETVVLSVRWGIHEPGPVTPADPLLARRGASFVTLRQGETMRACMGSVVRSRALHRDVIENARRAALLDPRFDPLTADEFAETDVDVTVLTSASSLTAADDGALHQQLRRGVDGLVMSHGDDSAVYLPEVWARYPDAEQFVAQLREKAGIAPTVPASDLELRRFTALQSDRVGLDRDVPRRHDVEAIWRRARGRARPRERVKRLVRR